MAHSKWAKTLDALQQPKAGSHDPEPPPTRAESGSVRRRSKRSDPAWRPYTLMLKSATHKEASILLKRMDSGHDLSDIAQDLFAQWVQEHS